MRFQALAVSFLACCFAHVVCLVHSVWINARMSPVNGPHGRTSHQCHHPFIILQDTLRAVLQHMMRTGAQRLFCITDNKAVEGVVSVGDVFKFFVELEGLSSEWTK